MFGFNKDEKELIDFIKSKEGLSSKEIFDSTNTNLSYASLKRLLTKLVEKKYIATKGQGKATKYIISPLYNVIRPINMEDYYAQELDERKINERFNFSLITDRLPKNKLFTDEELANLSKLQVNFKSHISDLSEYEYKREFERLAIDLSWKSSQIEGNTYSLLETERLLKEKERASGKTREEALMLLNHKIALDFIIDNPKYLKPLSLAKIEDIHSLLTRDLPIERNLRKRRVGISGTNYKPLDNEFQIKEALELSCELINKKENIFEKALLALLLLSYTQPFNDGNKRTARIVSNAILIDSEHCPLSFRTVNSLDYKKAMLLFYEQNNIFNFKKIFMEQFEFAVNTYF